jgi:flagellar basal-body rod protein FlgB
MAIAELPILSMLRARMQWHEVRQKLLAENVANADTPKFKPRDLTPLNLDGSAVQLSRTSPAHLAGATGTSFQADAKGYQVRSTGNSVNLEDEMLKVAANQMDYQAATTLYSRSLDLIKTALGKK